jgi:hypothetical protein
MWQAIVGIVLITVVIVLLLGVVARIVFGPGKED